MQWHESVVVVESRWPMLEQLAARSTVPLFVATVAAGRQLTKIAANILLRYGDQQPPLGTDAGAALADAVWVQNLCFNQAQVDVGKVKALWFPDHPVVHVVNAADPDSLRVAARTIEFHLEQLTEGMEEMKRKGARGRGRGVGY